MAQSKIVRQNFSSNNIRQKQDEAQIRAIVEDNQNENVVNASKVFENSENDYATSVMGIKSDPVLISEVCKLPSKGIPYGKALGDSIELRAMTTVEERMRLSGENFWSTMSNIMNRCLVNSDFDTKNLVDFDFFAALVKLRVVTYGQNYKVSSTCLKCGSKQDFNVDLDEVKISELPDDFEEPIKIGPMPRSGDILGIRFLRVFDHIAITNAVNEYKQKNSSNKLGSPDYTMEMERMLVSVNGRELDSMAKKLYIEKMTGMDSSYFHKEIEKLFYGVHRVGVKTCGEDECEGLMIYQIAPDSEFFRTSFDN